jgi:hypothetical protein
MEIHMHKFNFASRFAAVATAAALLPSVAMAQTGIDFDTTEVLGIVTDATTFIVAVGLAVLGLLMVAKGIKWVRKAG